MMGQLARRVFAVLAVAATVAAAPAARLHLPSAADFSSPDRLIAAVRGGPVVEHQDATARAADYTFFATTAAGTPVRWDSCAPIHYQVNTTYATRGALADVQAAVGQVARASGLRFVYDGPSPQIPTSRWDQDPHHPVLVAWASPTQTDLIKPGVSGNGGAGRVGDRYVTGSVVLNSDQNTLFAPVGGAGQTRVNLLEHELGHVVGLGHAQHPGQVMFGEISADTPDGFAAGDRAGLAQLGGC
jgi:hypothetical protein